jgi:hypothetical protein
MLSAHLFVVFLVASFLLAFLLCPIRGALRTSTFFFSETFTYYEAPLYAALFNLLSLHDSSVQIFSSAPPDHVPPLTSESTYTCKTTRKNIVSVLLGQEYFLKFYSDKLKLKLNSVV